MTQNPKTVPKETRVILGRTVLERSRDDAKESSHGRIVAVLRQGEAGEKVADICRKVGISEGTYYAWKNSMPGWGLMSCESYGSCEKRTGV